MKRDSEEKREWTLYKDGVHMMHAWSEEGAALVRRRSGEGVSSPEIGLQKK